MENLLIPCAGIFQDLNTMYMMLCLLARVRRTPTQWSVYEMWLMSNLHPICCWCVCIYAPNYHSINMNFCFCILPRLFGCIFPSIYVYLLSAVCVCDRARLGATEIHPVSFHVSSSVPAASLFSLAAQIKELTHAPVSFLFSISNSHFLALSFLQS